MNSKKLFKQYTFSAKVIQEWFAKELMKSVSTEELPKEFKEYVMAKGVDIESMTKMIDVNPRCLFDVLDENGIILNIVNYPHEGWMWHIEEESGKALGRRDAEKEGVIKALELLENILSEKKLIK